jgi:starch-binding outer membrane protein SusE/F
MQRKLIFFFILLAIIAGAGCKKTYNYSLDQTVSPVANLFAPQDSLFIALNPASGALVTFQWAPALAADGSLVQYEVAFDTVIDFKHPLFKLGSDGTGVNTQATISHSTLNQIAKMAGIAALDTGKVYWTIYSTKGLNEVKAAETNLLILARPAGFDSIPSDLYLSGSATEGGTDLSKAPHFKQTAAGVYELYTSLKSGSYQFVNANTGTPVSYSIDGANLKLAGSDTYTDTTAQVRFNLDFNNAVATITVIRSVDIWYAAMDDAPYHFVYNGNSTWIDQNELVQEPLESYGYDERYKFRFTVNAGNGASDAFEWYGSSNSDNSEPTSSTTAPYFYLTPVTNDQWNNCYKFITATQNNAQETITVFMQADAPYTHTVKP